MLAEPERACTCYTWKRLRPQQAGRAKRPRSGFGMRGSLRPLQLRFLRAERARSSAESRPPDKDASPCGPAGASA
eukprot:4771688-Alexandrium_andersonii.AAC.1